MFTCPIPVTAQYITLIIRHFEGNEDFLTCICIVQKFIYLFIYFAYKMKLRIRLGCFSGVPQMHIVYIKDLVEDFINYNALINIYYIIVFALSLKDCKESRCLQPKEFLAAL